MYRFFIFFTIFACTLPALTVNGIVQNVNNSHISFVIIQVPSSKRWTIADEFGHFTIKCDVGDSLLFNRYGYHQTYAIIKNWTDLLITLNNNPILLDRVESFSKLLSSTHFSKTYETDSAYNGNISSIFNQIPNAQLRTYGGLASNATLSIDGGPGSHTKVVYEGIDITSPQNGETDVSQLPPDIISSIAVATQPGVLFGSGTTDGIIYLRNSREQTAILFSKGSWGRTSWSASTFNHFPNLKIQTAFGQRSAKDNYKVTWREKSYDRKNNHFNQTYITSSLAGSINQRLLANGVFFYSSQKRGVAGQIYSPSLEAKRKDELMLLALNTTYLFSSGFITGSIQTRQSDEKYIDPNYNIDSRHKLEKYSLKLKAQARFNNTISLYFQGNSETEKIISSETNSHSRKNLSSFISSKINIQNSITIQPTIRLDNIGNDYNALTYNMDIIWQQTDHLKYIISGGNSFRAPTFNDMYWTPGGNTDLKPEKAIKLMTVTSWRKNEQYFDLTFRYIESKDLIQWIPGDNIWSPENIAETVRKSLSASGSISISTYTISGFTTRLWTRDLQQNKALRYAPELSGNIIVSAKLKKFTAGISGCFTGTRIAMYNFPDDEMLPSHFIPSLFIQKNFKIFKHPLSINLAADNILDTQFETILGYPEPGRSFYFSISIKQ